MNSLSPWDLSGLGVSFGLYRPRRPSYTRATQFYRERSESYRYATKRGNSDSAETGEEDYIERAIHGMARSSPGERGAVRMKDMNHCQPSRKVARCANTMYQGRVDSGSSPCETRTPPVANNVTYQNAPFDADSVFMDADVIPANKRKTAKNLTVLCVSFISMFSAFRATQNLQTSLYSDSHLGLTGLSCLYLTTAIAGLFTLTFVNKVHSKSAISIGMFCFIPWISANMYPQFYTLVPTSILAGVGQSILWSAEVSYIVKLAFDTTSKADRQDQDIVRFNGIFVACFQTHHMWGNLISSLVLSIPHESPTPPPVPRDNTTSDGTGFLIVQCGVLYPCRDLSMFAMSPKENVEDMFPHLWHVMLPYVIMAALSFFLVVIWLDRIGAQIDPSKTEKQLIVSQARFFSHHPTFRLLIPLLLFTGLQEGFIFADFNQTFVTCSLGIHYIGYCMITLGVGNVLGAVLIAIFASIVPREAILAVGAVVHVAIMVGCLLWIPDGNLALFLGLSAAWGFCDAVWNTQCNSLICVTCSEDAHTAFANCRVVQSAGLFLSFVSGSFLCVATKLYLLIISLVTAILFYVLAEYHLRHEDDVFNNDDATQQPVHT